MREYVADVQKLGCPSAPSQAIVVMDEPDRPQVSLMSEWLLPQAIARYTDFVS